MKNLFYILVLSILFTSCGNMKRIAAVSSNKTLTKEVKIQKEIKKDVKIIKYLTVVFEYKDDSKYSYTVKYKTSNVNHALDVFFNKIEQTLIKDNTITGYYVKIK